MHRGLGQNGYCVKLSSGAGGEILLLLCKQRRTILVTVLLHGVRPFSTRPKEIGSPLACNQWCVTTCRFGSGQGRHHYYANGYPRESCSHSTDPPHPSTTTTPPGPPKRQRTRQTSCSRRCYGKEPCGKCLARRRGFHPVGWSPRRQVGTDILWTCARLTRTFRSPRRSTKRSTWSHF